jgi:hypothetical protein
MTVRVKDNSQVELVLQSKWSTGATHRRFVIQWLGFTAAAPNDASSQQQHRTSALNGASSNALNQDKS